MTTEKAPVAGGAAGGAAGAGGAGGRFGAMQNLSAEDRAILRALAREDPGSAAAELFGFGRRGAGAPSAGRAATGAAAGAAPAAGGAPEHGAGAAAAAGVLTAVDEDAEGAEEAPVPREFEYYTDAEEDTE